MIPIPMIPLVLLTRNKAVMGEFINRNNTTIIAVAFVGIILAFNSYLIETTIKPLYFSILVFMFMDFPRAKNTRILKEVMKG
jgi:hypothetical protein